MKSFRSTRSWLVNLMFVPQPVSTETPDRVWMSEENPTPSLVEGKSYRFQCVAANVAPVKNVHLRWHFGDRVLQTKMVDVNVDTPLNMTDAVSLVVSRNQTGVKIWCEAKLVFEAPQQIISTKSNSAAVQVLCKFA